MNTCIDFLEEHLTPHCDDKLKMHLKKLCEHAKEIHRIEIRKAFNAARARAWLIFRPARPPSHSSRLVLLPAAEAWRSCQAT